jgi:drug/metabolite transporter (DMT)-like permease
VAGYLAINYALGHLPASIVSPTMLGQPVLTALLAGPLLGETLGLWQVVGGVAVLGGVYLVHRSQRLNEKKRFQDATTPATESLGGSTLR